MDEEKVILSGQLEQSSPWNVLGKKTSAIHIDERVSGAMDDQCWHVDRGQDVYNPSGRPPADPELRMLCREKTIAGVDRIYEILNDPDEPGATRVAAWCALRDTGYGKPAQAIAFKDFTEYSADNKLLQNGTELERMADMYAYMIGADPSAPPPMIDITPLPSRSVPRYDDVNDVDPETRPRKAAAHGGRTARGKRQSKPQAGQFSGLPMTYAPQPQPPRQRLQRPRRPRP
jgi:hypothetical protein